MLVILMENKCDASIHTGQCWCSAVPYCNLTQLNDCYAEQRQRSGSRRRAKKNSRTHLMSQSPSSRKGGYGACAPLDQEMLSSANVLAPINNKICTPVPFRTDAKEPPPYDGVHRRTRVAHTTMALATRSVGIGSANPPAPA